MIVLGIAVVVLDTLRAIEAARAVTTEARAVVRVTVAKRSVTVPITATLHTTCQTHTLTSSAFHTLTASFMHIAKYRYIECYQTYRWHTKNLLQTKSWAHDEKLQYTHPAPRWRRRSCRPDIATVFALRPVDALVTHTHAARARAVIVTAAVHVTRLARPAKVTGARVVGLAHAPAVHTVVVAPA